METVERLNAIIDMAQSLRNGLKEKSTPNVPELRKSVKGAFDSLVSEFDEGEVTHAFEGTA